MGRVMFRTKFSDRIVVAGSTKYVNPETCLGKVMVTDLKSPNDSKAIQTQTTNNVGIFCIMNLKFKMKFFHNPQYHHKMNC